MNAIIQLEKLAIKAKKYSSEAQQSVVRNNHMNELTDNEIIDQRHIDAVLVDFINTVAMSYGIDYALNTKDLKTE